MLFVVCCLLSVFDVVGGCLLSLVSLGCYSLFVVSSVLPVICYLLFVARSLLPVVSYLLFVVWC